MPHHENPVVHHENPAPDTDERPERKRFTPRRGIPVVTTNDLPGRKIEQVMGMCYGTAVRSRNIFGNMLGDLRATFGGGQQGYVKMINQTRDEAIEALKAHAMSMGANAIVAMRFDSGEFDSGNAQSMNEVAAYGTAVIVSDA